MNDLNIGLCQFDIEWENPEANRLKITHLLERQAKQSLDLIVLPEMFSTGFSMNSESLAEAMNGKTIHWMQAISNQYKTAITGSLIIHEKEHYLNRLIWCEPGKETVLHYDKKHLFTLAGEDLHYHAGSSKLIVNYKSWRLTFFICYDLRFPVWSRNSEKSDLMIFVANFPEKRKQAWNTLLPARAIENQCYVAGVNRIGFDGNGINHAGDSAVYNYEGNKILDLSSKEELKCIQLDYNSLQVYKRAYPFLKDDDIYRIES